MPWILWRHHLLELAKVFLITTAVVVSVVAFGAVIQPVSQGLLSPAGMLKYMGLATVPMLQFAAPLAAGFAATVVFHRFASDNELLAMSVAGLSYRRILAPVVGGGLVLGLGSLLLLHEVAPRFFDAMHLVIANDAARVVVGRLESGDSFQAGDLIVHADEARLLPGAPPSGAAHRMVLDRVATLQRDGRGGIETEFIARQAVVDLHPVDGAIIMKMVLREAVIIREGDGTAVRVPEARPDAVRIGTARPREPKSFAWAELHEAIRRPESTARVQQARRALEDALLLDAAAQAAEAALREGRALRFHDLASKREYQITGGAPGADGSILPSKPGGLVRITELQGGAPWREGLASSLRRSRLRIRDDDGIHQPEFGYAAEIIEASSLRPGVTGAVRFPSAFSEMVLLEAVMVPEATDWLAAHPGGDTAAGPDVPRLAAAYRQSATDLHAEANSYWWQRLAQSASVPLVVLLGGVLAVWLRHSLPLTIYVLAFVPAVLDMVLISSGQHWIRSGSTAPGLALLWGGNIGMALILAVVWRRMARH